MFGLIFGPLRLVLKVLSGLFTLLVLYFGITFLQIWHTGHEHSTGHAQAILIFGTTEDNGTPSPELRARLDEALVVYGDHRAPWFVVTGGNRPGDHYTEAGVSATYLERHGVPATRIIIGGGTDTWQNVSSVIDRLRALGIRSVITVTDPFHEFRAMAIASSQGLSPMPSPVTDSPTIKYSLWRYYLKETLEVGVGRIVGFGQLSRWTTSNGISLPSGG